MEWLSPFVICDLLVEKSCKRNPCEMWSVYQRLASFSNPFSLETVEFSTNQTVRRGVKTCRTCENRLVLSKELDASCVMKSLKPGKKSQRYFNEGEH